MVVGRDGGRRWGSGGISEVGLGRYLYITLGLVTVISELIWGHERLMIWLGVVWLALGLAAYVVHRRAQGRSSDAGAGGSNTSSSGTDVTAALRRGGYRSRSTGNDTGGFGATRCARPTAGGPRL